MIQTNLRIPIQDKRVASYPTITSFASFGNFPIYSVAHNKPKM